ncbi:MAG: LacI family DNA-binding transcriptional regulator [Victivallales bacterium]|nr:LacI family DNA-binding transcriptional regulator [Victivallales bacterium]
MGMLDYSHVSNPLPWITHFHKIRPGAYLNLREIAKKLNVSLGTVSAALSGNPKNLPFSKQTLERIRSYAMQVGYVPNRFAQKIFHPERENSLGVIFLQDTAVDRNLPLLPHIIRRMSDHSAEYQIQGCSLNSLKATVQLMRGMNIRRIITVGMTYAKDFAGMETFNDVEIFATDYIDGNVPQPGCVRCACVTNRDEFHQELAENLVRLGLDPIATNSDVAFLYRQGFIPEHLYFDAPEERCNFFEFGYDVAVRLMPFIKKRQCRTIVMHNDRSAAGALKALREHHVRIPASVQVLGFNDSDYTGYLTVPLTTVQVPTKTHLDRVLDFLLNGGELPRTIFTPLKMIPRDSTTAELNRLYSGA